MTENNNVEKDTVLVEHENVEKDTLSSEKIVVDDEKLNFWQKFVKFLKNSFYDFISSFKYNNMKLAAILVAIPGIFLGFFLKYHTVVVNELVFETGIANEAGETVKYVYLKPFDYTGVAIFILMLAGILNLFAAVNMKKKKSLGSVIVATISTVVIVFFGIAYIYAIFKCRDLVDQGIKCKAQYGELLPNHGILMGKRTNGEEITKDTLFTSDYYVSIASVVVSMISSVVGVILGFIKHDRTYEKVDR